jgi:DNA-binding beta-propeller fold protein YncE
MAGWAQSSAGVAGPVTGFVFEAQSGQILPMMGIPRTAYLGAPVLTGLAAAAVAPDGSAVLAVERGGHLVLDTGLRGPTPAAVSIPGAIGSVDGFAWAAEATTAAVYSSSSRQAQIIGGIGPSPSAGAPIDLSDLPGPLSTLACDGQYLIMGAAGNGTGGIYVANGAAGIQRLAAARNPSAVVVSGPDLYFADTESQQIWQIQSYARTPAVLLFADDRGISNPAGLQVSADGKRLYVANAGNRTLAVYDIASRAPLQTLALSCTPTRLDPFGSRSVFLLNATGQGPLYVLSDDGPSQLAVYFVPVAPPRGPRKILIHPV